jgi:hypothetical protein
MGITYQTSNRLRRKVMTAPLVLPAQVVEVAPVVESPSAPVTSKWWWMAAVAGATAAAMLAQKAF